MLIAPEFGVPVLRLRSVTECRQWHKYIEFQVAWRGRSVCVRGVHTPRGSRRRVANKPAVLRRLAALASTSDVLLIGGDLNLTPKDKAQLTDVYLRVTSLGGVHGDEVFYRSVLSARGSYRLLRWPQPPHKR